MRLKPSLLCLVLLFPACNRGPDRAQINPAKGTEQPSTSDSQTDADMPQSKDAAHSSPTVEAQEASFHISLEPLLGSEGNVHTFFLHQRPAPDEEPFFVVWSDARGYAGGTGYPSAQNIPPRKNLVEGDYRFQYGGTENTYDREIEWSFEVAVDEKARFEIDGKTYEFAKGTLLLISGRDGEVRVKQLIRDPSRLPADRNSVIAFAKDDPDIGHFLTQSAISQ